MSPPPDVDRLSHADLKDLVLRLLEEVAELRRTVAAQRDEIARLKGGSGRPNIKPSGMDSATESKQSLAGGEPRQKGSKTSKLSIHEERTVELEAPPQGARFKGYTDYVVQDLMTRPHVVNFRCERWQTADGAYDIVSATTSPGAHTCNSRARKRRANGHASSWSSMTIGLTRCRKAVISCDRRETRTGNGARLGGTAST